MKPMKSQGWNIEEQIIEDPISGLTFQFEIVPDSPAQFRLRVFGNLRFGNREFIFNEEGQHAGSSTFLAGACKPTWLQAIES